MRNRSFQYRIRRTIKRLNRAMRISRSVSDKTLEPYMYVEYNSAVKRSMRLATYLRQHDVHWF